MVRKLSRQLLALLPLVLLSSGFGGCPKDPYRASISGSAKVADAVHTAVEVTTEYYATGKVNDGEKAVIAGYLNTVTDANMKFRHGAVDLHNAGVVGSAQYIALAQAFVAAVPTDPLAFQYKSPDAQAKFATVLGAVKTALNLIASTVQNAKGGK